MFAGREVWQRHVGVDHRQTRLRILIRELTGGLEIAFPIELIEKLFRFEIRERKDNRPSATTQLSGQRHRVFEDFFRRADELRPAGLPGVDPLLRFLLIEEILLEFPSRVRRAELFEPLLLRALIGESLVTTAGLGKFLADEPGERAEVGIGGGERLEFRHARLPVFEQSKRGLVGNGLGPELVAEIVHGFDGASLAFGRLQHGGITQPRIQGFEIRAEIFGVFLPRGGEIAAELVDPRIVIVLFRRFRVAD